MPCALASSRCTSAAQSRHACCSDYWRSPSDKLIFRLAHRMLSSSGGFSSSHCTAGFTSEASLAGTFSSLSCTTRVFATAQQICNSRLSRVECCEVRAQHAQQGNVVCTGDTNFNQASTFLVLCYPVIRRHVEAYISKFIFQLVPMTRIVECVEKVYKSISAFQHQPTLIGHILAPLDAAGTSWITCVKVMPRRGAFRVSRFLTACITWTSPVPDGLCGPNAG
jgi:hypothetical protein